MVFLCERDSGEIEAFFQKEERIFLRRAQEIHFLTRTGQNACFDHTLRRACRVLVYKRMGGREPRLVFE